MSELPIEAKPEPPEVTEKISFWHKHRKKLLIAGPTIALLILGFFLGFGNYSRTAQQTEDSRLNIKPEDSEAVKAGKQLSGGNCEGEGVDAKLSRSPMDPEDFTFVIPYGLMVGDHVTPIDHQYFSPADYNSKVNAYEVYAMADGHISSIGQRTNTNQPATEYRLTFTQTCTFQYYYDLVTGLAPDLNTAFDQSRNGGAYTNDKFNYEVKAGQLIGYIGGRTLDFAVWDTTKPLQGFITPHLYRAESWKLYTVDPLEYYTPELKEFILSRYVRTVEPISGRIDYDEDGKLIGNWFLEGTHYGGVEGQLGGPGTYKGHLSFSPEHFDPSAFVISIGDYAGEAKQFVAKGNTPWPGDVTTANGLVKYELVEIGYVQGDGSFWDRKSKPKGGLKVKPSQFVKGTVLVQLLEDRKLKFEAFPGKTATQVSGFSSGAKIFIR